ncbi:hypothetical protein CSC82_02160 [Rhodobacteraceae bacterium 4F10]|nr:hypothetical protein CSC82_02160 [Rhodobacteraceae bacterium 4F10]
MEQSPSWLQVIQSWPPALWLNLKVREIMRRTYKKNAALQQSQITIPKFAQKEGNPTWRFLNG